jgi:hypothetical protein
MNGPLNIAANSGIDGLEITQSGAGNGLHVTGTTGLVGNTTLTGNLDVSGDIDVDGTTNLDVVDIDGAVDMASTALVTGVLTTTAATVFNGGFASNAASTITTADNTDTLSLISTDADAIQGPNLRLYRNSSSPADNDVLGIIHFQGRNDNSQDVVYAEIGAQARDVSDGSENTNYFINTMVAGALRNRINAFPTETVINEESIDVDFRVESDSNANMLFVDASTDSVSIGTSVHLGGTLNLYNGSFRGQAAGALTATMLTPTAFGYSPGTYAVTMLGAPNTGGTVSIGYDPSGNLSGSFTGSGIEMLFGANMYFLQPNAADNGYVQQIHMENATGVTINENGLDLDFRVESDGNANMLFVDGGANHVNIGTATDLNGVLNVDGNLSLSGAGTSNRYVALLAETSTYAGTLMLQAGGGSSSYGAAVVMHGHSHATNPGMLYLAGSAGAGGKGVVIGRNGNNVTTASEMLTAYSDGAELVINEFGNDQDFRVESDNNASMLTVDASADLVTISGGSKVTDEVLRVNGAQVVGSDAAGVYTVGLNEIFAASAAKYLRIQQDGSLFGGLTITATGDYSNVNAIGCFQKIYSIGANNSNTTLFSPGNVTVADLGETSGQFSMGTPTKPNATTIYIPLENLNASYILDMSITVEFRGRIGGINSVDILDQ